MALNKNAKFFCENCSTEVKQHAKFCPKCGRFFASVKCPNCGKIGASSEFSKGCPRCGYALPPKNVADSLDKNPLLLHKKKAEDALPPWIYVVSIILLGSILAVLVNML